MTESNAQQRTAWNGCSGEVWTGWADRFEAGVAGYRDAFRAAAAVGAGERVLDVGCGSGATTLDAAAATGPRGRVHGVDLSAPLVALARERAAGTGWASFAVADAQTDDLGTGYDVAISRNGVMFFDDPAAAFANVHRALRPGGRALLQVWQPVHRQEWLRAVLDALDMPAPPGTGPGPFSLADPARTAALLRGAGFADVRIEDVRAPMWFGADVEDAASFLLALHGPGIADRPEADRAAAGRSLHEALTGRAAPGGVTLGSAAWLVHATRP